MMDAGDWVTVAAVVVALTIGTVSLVEMRRRENRDRKLLFLQRIADWASELASCRLGHETTDPTLVDPRQIVRAITRMQGKTGFSVRVARKVFPGAIGDAAKEARRRIDGLLLAQRLGLGLGRAPVVAHPESEALLDEVEAEYREARQNGRSAVNAFVQRHDDALTDALSLVLSTTTSAIADLT